MIWAPSYSKIDSQIQLSLLDMTVRTLMVLTNTELSSWMWTIDLFNNWSVSITQILSTGLLSMTMVLKESILFLTILNMNESSYFNLILIDSDLRFTRSLYLTQTKICIISLISLNSQQQTDSISTTHIDFQMLKTATMLSSMKSSNQMTATSTSKGTQTQKSSTVQTQCLPLKT